MIGGAERPGVKNASGGDGGGGNKDMIYLGMWLFPHPWPPGVIRRRGAIAPSQVASDAILNRKFLQGIGALTVLVIEGEFEGGGRARNNIVAVEMDVAIATKKLMFGALQSEVASTSTNGM